jgi:phage tail sheath gpL-like
MLKKMFPVVLVLCAMMVFMWTGCSNGSDDIGVSGIFSQTAQADGTSQRAVYTITVLGTAARNGICTLGISTVSGSGAFEAGATSGDIANGIATYLWQMTVITSKFTISSSQNFVTLTAKTTDVEYNNLPCFIIFN